MKKHLLIGVILLLTSCEEFNKKVGLRDNNPIELAVEEVIKEETGVEVNFTPDASQNPQEK